MPKREKKIKKVLIFYLIFAKVSGVTHWLEIKTAGRAVQGMAVSGPNSEYVVNGALNEVDVYKINWVAGSFARVKTMTLGYSDLTRISFLGADNSSNTILAGKSVVRVNVDPSSPNNDQEYAVEAGDSHYAPYWVRETSFLFVGVFEANSGKHRIYRMLAFTNGGMKTFSLTANTKSYGALANSNWLVVSLEQTDKRLIYDYTSGYDGVDGGAGAPIATHIKSGGINAAETSLVSPPDNRGYYVVSDGGGKRIYTVRDVGGAEKLNLELSTLTRGILQLSWIPDTDYVLAISFEYYFAIADFMDETKSTPPIYQILPNSDWRSRNCFAWEDKKVVGLQTSTGAATHLYQILDQMPCSELCLTCEGIFRKKCLTCQPNSSLSSGGDSCSCDYGYYEAKRGYTTKECLSCSPLCGTCSGGASTDCLGCKHSYME